MLRLRLLSRIVPGIAISAGLLTAQPARVSFARDVEPLFRNNCYNCHGPAVQANNFRLDRRRDSLPNRVGANGARVIPGNSAGSRLYLRITGQAGLQMPPTGALNAEQIETIKAWIDQGAEWPDELANEAPSVPRDGHAAKIMEAVRRGDRPGFEKLLRANPNSVKGQGPGGSTPLMYAALYRDLASLRLLLAKGADPNTRNDAGATALLWAVDDAQATRLLLEHAADPNIPSSDGTTPLLLAAARAGSSEVVKLLLDHGAKPEGNLLARAGGTGDAALIRLLLEHGADKKLLPADLALRSECKACVDLLLPLASKQNLDQALTIAARFGEREAIAMLLGRGATANSAALKLAAVEKPGPREAPQATRLPTAFRTARQAVEKSLPLLQQADVVFLRKAGCISCHNNSLTEMTLAVAREKGYAVDEASARSQLDTIRAYLESWRERALQDIAIPGGVDTSSYILAGLAAANYAPDPATDSIAIYLKRRQTADGRWRIAAARPPIESSDFAATAVTMRALQAYAPGPRQAEFANAVKRGAGWLSQAQPVTTEDHVFQVRGLAWAGGNKQALRQAARDLAALQRPDGGWAQLVTLASDAYATGQALTALAVSGAISSTDPVMQRGAAFLLATQLEDGSWHVATRAIPSQPYFDSEFPHGHDQFISAAATNWATMALARWGKN
jgi:ankyrin repeat protein